MTTPLAIIAMGAVTAVGLDAEQTCAAIRAGVSGFGTAIALPAPQEPILGAVVPASRGLKQPPSTWLINLTARAIEQCLVDEIAGEAHPALLLVLPENARHHPGLRDFAEPRQFIASLEQRLGRRFHTLSQALEGGAAVGVEALVVARDLILKERVGVCLVAGVDSLINRGDLSRLRVAGRLHGVDQPQGVIPGEGAAAVALTGGATAPTRTQILGVGSAREEASATAVGPRYSVGDGLRQALERALADSGRPESAVSLRVADMNGERYRAWESVIAAARFYRTVRERLPVWYPAMSVGDVGAAAGVLAMIVAARGIQRGYAPGPLAVCEASSENTLRAACVLGQPPNGRIPPFRSRE